MLYLSEGFPVSLESNVVERLRKFADLANEHRVVFDGIDTGGLRAHSPSARMRSQLRRDNVPNPDDPLTHPGGSVSALSLFCDQPYVSLTMLAESPGGLVTTDTNDIVGAARRVLEDSRATYTLGYTPTNGTMDGSYRRITVRVSRPDVRVRARPGYWARPSEYPTK